MNQVREELEKIEKLILSPKAKLSIDSKGREKPEKDCPMRTKFLVDRDRILYSKAFRRLKDKTQVFLAPEGDHYRTRLTHTLEVSQIARHIARCLRLNEDLTEAVALGHDLGHTPFGHAGEHVLAEICAKGFKHNEQSVRVVEVIEGNGGLNLTAEVRDGIRNHTGPDIPETLEGQIIRFADRIAYINHDIDDAIRAKVFAQDTLPKECIKVLGKSTGERIRSMINNIVQNSINSDIIKMSPEFQQAKDELRRFMFENVYLKSVAKNDEDKAKNIVRELYNYFMKNPKELPCIAQEKLTEFGIETVVCDYIAGMTDRYALKKFEEIFIPKGWY